MCTLSSVKELFWFCFLVEVQKGPTVYGLYRDGGQPLLSDLAGPAEKKSDLSQNASPRHDC